MPFSKREERMDQQAKEAKIAQTLLWIRLRDEGRRATAAKRSWVMRLLPRRFRRRGN